LLLPLEWVSWNSPTLVRFQPDSARKRSHNLHETYQLACVQWMTSDDRHRGCSKHVEFYDKIKFLYRMHLVGCFVRSFRFTVFIH
jgi:hypothetical protein